MEDFFDELHKLGSVIDIYSDEEKYYKERNSLKNFEKFFEHIYYLNEDKYIEYINTQLDVVYCYSALGKKSQSNKVMVYLISDMVKVRNYEAIDYVLYTVDIKRLNSSSMEALRRTTFRLKNLNYRRRFISDLKTMYQNEELNYALNDRFMLEE
ncbi:hypothetical protein ACT4ZA_02490 [Acinetobacter baumannii]